MTAAWKAIGGASRYLMAQNHNKLAGNSKTRRTDGKTDVFVFDASVQSTNITQLTNFDPGEDYFLFRNMDGRDLTVGDLGTWGSGAHIGDNFVLFHGNGESANILVQGLPYEHATVEQMILPFDGKLVFDDPFGFL